MSILSVNVLLQREKNSPLTGNATRSQYRIVHVPPLIGHLPRTSELCRDVPIDAQSPAAIWFKPQ